MVSKFRYRSRFKFDFLWSQHSHDLWWTWKPINVPNKRWLDEGSFHDLILLFEYYPTLDNLLWIRKINYYPKDIHTSSTLRFIKRRFFPEYTNTRWTSMIHYSVHKWTFKWEAMLELRSWKILFSLTGINVFFVLCRLTPTCKQHVHFDLDYSPLRTVLSSTHCHIISHSFLFLLAYIAAHPQVFLTIITIFKLWDHYCTQVPESMRTKFLIGVK